ncbi:energy-coupling factor transporter ATPase [Candidatus Formimonas warabiya]|uniref:energy-coupling factor transporter ATPase n=1 Tax=Formimonas warabiya TaxID=1761012 RepID=UPI001F01D378|nr:energy-coupling factor transporter ATPase [Candidatus Formimonas warabiya]
MISIKSLSYAYKTQKGETKALDEVNLDIKKGEWLAIIGPNGSGKSTLARHLNALLLPESGTVTVEGMDTSDAAMIWKIRQKVAFVFQNPDNQLIATTVEEDVAFGPENLGFPPQKIAEQVAQALQVVGMMDFRESAPHLLSGGQKQRVAIAGALAMNPEYLVMDEATAMLDPQGRQEVIKTLSHLNQELKLTIVYITHFMEEVVFAHRVAVLDQGKVKITGTPKEVFAQSGALMKMGLDVPEITLLADKLKQKGWIRSGGITTINEMVESLCQLK